MPLGLCNAPTTFILCILCNSPYIVEDSMEVFIDDLKHVFNIMAGTTKFHGNQSCSKLGEVSFYGERG